MAKRMKKSDLEIFLKQYSLWYPGMSRNEMEECRQALENSLCDSSSSGYSTANSLNESAGHLSTSSAGGGGGSGNDSVYPCEINYNNFTSFRYTTQPLNTTTAATESSPPSSPEIVKRYIVRADVHHPMDWSPLPNDTTSATTDPPDPNSEDKTK